MSIMCEACGTKPAKIHYVEVVNNKKVELDLCMECAEERGIRVPKSGVGELGDLAAGLIDTLVDSESEKIGKVHCSFCGYAYSNFKRVGRFGCPECYISFRTQVLPLLRQIHGSVVHRGKSPEEAGPKAGLKRELARLKNELNRAVEVEEYEKAAKIRDRIREVTKKVEEA
jgi:protein arginine kinase activator